MGVGHVPPDPLRAPGAGAHVQGRERRGTAESRALDNGAHALGRRGEDLVAAWYRRHGYAIVDRNWSCRTPDVRGEIDLVASRSGVLVFCEVKTRSSMAFGGPVAAVGPAKQARLRSLALAYLRTTGASAGSLRFDVACVLGSTVEVIEAAF